MADAVPDPQEIHRRLPNYRLRFVLLTLAAFICVVLSFSVGRYSLGITDVALVFLSAVYSVTESAFEIGTAVFSILPPLSPLSAMIWVSSMFFSGVLEGFSLSLSL